MIQRDPIHNVLKILTESTGNINPGNLLIGQEVEVKVTDASNNVFIRPMEVGEVYSDGNVLVKDETTQEGVVLQYQWNTAGIGGLLYTLTTPFGVRYDLIIDKNRSLFSNQSKEQLIEKINIEKEYKELQSEYGDVTPELMDELVAVGEYSHKEAEDIYNYQFKVEESDHSMNPHDNDLSDIDKLDESIEPKIISRRVEPNNQDKVAVTVVQLRDDEGDYYIVGMNDTDKEFEEFEMYQTEDKSKAISFASKLTKLVDNSVKYGKLDKDSLSFRSDLSKFVKDNKII